MCSRVARACGVICRLSAVLPSNILHTLYNALIYPHITYCIPVWGTSSLTELVKLKKLQDRAIKFIYSRPPIEVYGINKLLPLNYIYRYFTAVQFHKDTVSAQCAYFADKIAEEQVHHDHLTRAKADNKLTLPFPRISKYISSYIYQGIKIWNTVPLEIRNTNCILIFKRLHR